MYCIKCGAENNDGAVFCKYCGERMISAAGSAPQVVTQTPAQVKEETQTPPPVAVYAQHGQQSQAVMPKGGKRGLIIGIAAAAAVVVLAAVLLPVLLAAPVYGNTVMNINNAGLAAENEGWIYYSNTSEGFRLYKIRTDGTGKTKLTDTAADNINVAGGWVYFRDFMYGHSICRVRTDGTDEKTIKRDVSPGRLLVYGDWIYYTAADQEADFNNRSFFRMRTDGSEEVAYGLQLVGDEFNIIDGWIYFREIQDSKCYKMLLDGSQKTELGEEYSYASTADGWIYYRGAGNLSRVRLDGTGQEVLTDDMAGNINAADGWVYYTVFQDNESVYRVRTDGTQREKLNDEPSSLINIAGGWIYYYSHGVCRMRPDGSENGPVD